MNREGITCEGARERFASVIDGEAPAAEREEILAHVGRCPACAKEWAAHREARAAFDEARIEPTEEERAAILAAAGPILTDLRERDGRPRPVNRGPRRGFPMRRLAAAAAAAAAVLVALFGIRGGDEMEIASVDVTSWYEHARGESGEPFPIGTARFSSPR